MFFRWLKQYMPRSLYGRAALILIVPVVTLQLAVFLVTIQRHFEGVTLQLTRSIQYDITYVQGLERKGDPEAAQQVAKALALRMETGIETPPQGDQTGRFDLTGGWVLESLRANLPGLIATDLRQGGLVTVYLQGETGVYSLSFSRARVSATNPHQLLVWTVGIGLLMTVISFLYLRNQLRPIKRLARAAEAFGKGHHVPYRPTGATEVRSAGQAFLEMRARIERHIEQRTLILSGVSHDLRTPLTRLRLGLSMLDPADAADMERDVADMQRLLDEFLVFARRDLEATNASEETNPLALVQDIIAANQARGVAVTLAKTTGEGTMMLRPFAIRRALENLIGNAVRYAGRAEVSVSLTDTHLTISVEDNGPGIPADQREDALKPFTRLDPARNQNQNTGVGLGLSIAADIARAHGGRIRLSDSERLGGLKAEIVIAR
jgi:two-component system osmolarity sensor histidine kinase EnvZ